MQTWKSSVIHGKDLKRVESKYVSLCKGRDYSKNISLLFWHLHFLEAPLTTTRCASGARSVDRPRPMWLLKDGPKGTAKYSDMIWCNMFVRLWMDRYFALTWREILYIVGSSCEVPSCFHIGKYAACFKQPDMVLSIHIFALLYAPLLSTAIHRIISIG